MEVYLSDFSQGSIRANVTEGLDHKFSVDIPDYHLILTVKKIEEVWECTSYTGMYNPVWVQEIAYQISHLEYKSK